MAGENDKPFDEYEFLLEHIGNVDDESDKSSEINTEISISDNEFHEEGLFNNESDLQDSEEAEDFSSSLASKLIPESHHEKPVQIPIIDSQNIKEGINDHFKADQFNEDDRSDHSTEITAAIITCDDILYQERIIKHTHDDSQSFHALEEQLDDYSSRSSSSSSYQLSQAISHTDSLLLLFKDDGLNDEATNNDDDDDDDDDDNDDENGLIEETNEK